MRGNIYVLVYESNFKTYLPHRLQNADSRYITRGRWRGFRIRHDLPRNIKRGTRTRSMICVRTIWNIYDDWADRSRVHVLGPAFARLGVHSRGNDRRCFKNVTETTVWQN